MDVGSGRQRYLMIKTLLALVGHMAMDGWTYQDAFVCWAIRLAEFEGRPADMPFLIEKTGLARATIQRRLEANRRAGYITVTFEGNGRGRRKHYAHTPRADARVVDYYAALERVLERWREETG
jgi:hypothetical protein